MPERFPRRLCASLGLMALLFTAALLALCERAHNFFRPEMDAAHQQQTLWLLSHGLPPENTILGVNAFSDHINFIYYAVAPFYGLLEPHLGGYTTLCLFHIAAVLATGWGLLSLAWGEGLRDTRLQCSLAFGFLVSPFTVFYTLYPMLGYSLGMASATAAMVAARRGNLRAALLWIVLVGACCEISLITSLGFALALLPDPRGEQRRMGRWTFAVAAGWLAFLLLFVMPMLHNSHDLLTAKRISEQLPGANEQQLSLGQPQFWFLEGLRLALLLLCTGGLLLLRPRAWLAFAPAYVGSFLMTNPLPKLLFAHYQGLLLPGFFWAAEQGLLKLKPGQRRRGALALAAGSVLAYPLLLSQSAFTLQFHTAQEAQQWRQAVEMIGPSDSALVATPALSHAANRRRIESYPPYFTSTKDWRQMAASENPVRWILWEPHDLHGPPTETTLVTLDMMHDPRYGLVATIGPLWVLRLGAPHRELALPDVSPEDRAEVYVGAGQHELAVRALERVRTNAQTPGGHWLILGGQLDAIGQSERAERAYREALHHPLPEPVQQELRRRFPNG